MNKALVVIRALRLPNLAIVLLSLYLPYFMVLRPAIAAGGGVPSLDERAFWWLAFAVVLTTLAGYFINDIFDEKIDAINRPQRWVVGRYVSRRWALVLYFLLMMLIIVVAFRLGFRFFPDRRNDVLMLFLGVNFLLYAYARWLKCSPLLGNCCVAFLCSIVPVLVWLPETRPLHILSLTQPDLANQTRLTCVNFSIFAFLTNLFREILKDIEDLGGDAACGCRTLPVVRGIYFSRRVAAMAGIILLAAVAVLIVYWKDNFPSSPKWWLGVLLLALPCMAAIWITQTGTTKRDFSLASGCVKVVMVLGLLLLSF